MRWRRSRHGHGGPTPELNSLARSATKNIEDPALRGGILYVQEEPITAGLAPWEQSSAGCA